MDKQKAREAEISEASTAILVSTPSCYQAKLVYSLSLKQNKKQNPKSNKQTKTDSDVEGKERRGEKELHVDLETEF